MSHANANHRTRVMLFTDTLGDVNGVSRFLNDAASEAARTQRDLLIVTSTRFKVEERPQIVNVRPRVAIAMPRYEHLEVVLPRASEMRTLAEAWKPTAIHVSTPGPVGLVGRSIAKRLRVPLLGTYHTDFPAYIERLFEVDGLTLATRNVMARFYKPFDVVFTRSKEYREAVVAMGVDASRVEALKPGIRTDRFNTSWRDMGVWQRLGLEGGPANAQDSTVRFLSVGRVSVEKNLPLLAKVWRRADMALRERGVDAALIVVGDGPYLEPMRRELEGTRTHFLGFRHGEELSKIYASANAFVFPSTTDTLGQVVLEAQSSGLPVLVSDVGGPKAVVNDGVTGHVLRADDEAHWSQAMVDLASDDGRRTTMGQAASTHAQEFSIARSIDHFWEVHVNVGRRE